MPKDSEVLLRGWGVGLRTGHDRASHGAVHELTRQLFFSNNNVKRFKTLVSMSRVKIGLTVPVALED